MLPSFCRFLFAAPRLYAFLALVCLCASIHAATAATLNVPAQYSTIQAAVNAAADGDTVLVADGTYSGPGNRDIDPNGKNLTVTSQHGAASTIIDCGGYATSDGSGNHRGFYLHSGETAVTISGFTVKNGYETYVPRIADSDSGGGIDIVEGGCVVTLTDCSLTGNTASDSGGGVTIFGDTATLTNCTLASNTASNGGGIDNGSTIMVALTDCSLTGNTATQGGGINNGGTLR